MITIEKKPAVTNQPFHTTAPGRPIKWSVGPKEGGTVNVLAEAAQTGRRCTVAMHELPAGDGGPFHAHEEDEGFYVLEGDITFIMADDELEIPATKGEFVWHPAKRFHGFKVGDRPVKMLQFLFPGTELVPRFFEAVEGEKGWALDSPEKLGEFVAMAGREFNMKMAGPSGPPPSSRPRSARGPATPDARLLFPSETEGIANVPFKSDASAVMTMTIDRGMMTGVECIFHAFGHQTGNAFGLLEIVWNKPDLVGPHVHTLEDEGFYVLEGEITLYIAADDGVMKVVGHPGDFIWAPRDVPHYFSLTGEAGTRVLSCEIPGGSMTQYFAAIAAGRGEDLSTDEKLGEFVEWGVRTAGIHFLTPDEWPGEITP